MQVTGDQIRDRSKMAGEELPLRQNLVTVKGSRTNHRQVCKERLGLLPRKRATAPRAGIALLSSLPTSLSFP